MDPQHNPIQNSPEEMIVSALRTSLAQPDPSHAYYKLRYDLDKAAAGADDAFVDALFSGASLPGFRDAVREAQSRLPASEYIQEENLEKLMGRELLGCAMERLVALRVGEVHSAVDQERYSELPVLVDACRKAAIKLFSAGRFTIEESDVPFTQADFESGHGIQQRMLCTVDGSCASSDLFQQLHGAIKLGEFCHEFLQHTPRADLLLMQAEKERMGAKGAWLAALTRAKVSLQPLLDRAHLSFEIPDFTFLAGENSVKRFAGEDIEPDLKEAYRWARSRAVMLRSSAVYTEEGSGVYQSYLLPENATYPEFRHAALAVIDSLHSPGAVEYRAQVGFQGEERMAVVIQEFIPSEDRAPTGYVNTARPGIPDVVEVVWQKRFLPEYSIGADNEIKNSESTMLVFRRNDLQHFIGGQPSHEEHGLVFTADHTWYFNPRRAGDFGKIGLILERHFGTPIQFEYVTESYRTWIVQNKSLPKEWREPCSVEFPAHAAYIWRGPSLGVIDRELQILDDSAENWQRDGVVIVDSGEEASRSLRWLDRVIPKSGAVILVRPSRMMRGHVESRCAVRGVTIISSPGLRYEEGAESFEELIERFFAAYGTEPPDWFFNRGSRPEVLPPSEKLKSLRIVSTGLSARVYAPDPDR